MLAACRAGITTMTLGRPPLSHDAPRCTRSPTSSAPPRAPRAATASGRRSRPAASAASARRPADRVPLRACGRRSAWYRLGGRPEAMPTRPSSHPITIWPPRTCDTRSTSKPQARAASAGLAPRGGPGGGAGPDAASGRRTAGPEGCPCWAPRSRRCRPAAAAGQLRESPRRDPEGARASARRRPRPTLPRLRSSGSSRTSLCRESRSRPTASRPRRRSASIRTASPAPTSRTGPGGAIRSRRPANSARVRRRSGSPIKANAARFGPVPGSVGLLQLLLGGPGIRGGRATRPAPGSAPQPNGAAVQGRPAPDAVRDPRPSVLHDSQTYAPVRIWTSGVRHTAQTSRDSSRWSARSAKSSTPIASARGSTSGR